MDKHITVIALAGFTLFAASLTPPAVASAQTGGDVEVSDSAPQNDNRGLGEALWITGLAVWIPTYVLTGAAATTLVTLANTRTATIAESWIPFLGPWIMLGDSRDFDSLQLAGTAISGILQALSLASFIAGVVLANETPHNPRAASAVLSPLASPGGGGLQLSGAF